MKTRRQFFAEFKAKVALEAIRSERTISELAMKHQLHLIQITQWKWQAINRLAKVFDDKASDPQAIREAEVTKLHAKMAKDRPVADLPGNEDQRVSSAAPHLSLPAVASGHRAAHNQVWFADVTYIPMRRGFPYLKAIMDWATRKLLACWLSNTMDGVTRLTTSQSIVCVKLQI